MVSKYPWLRIRFEYSDKYSSYIVSFSPSEIISSTDDFNWEAMDFEDNLNDLYGEQAPLFCDDESLFKLPCNAVTIENTENISVQTPIMFTCDIDNHDWRFCNVPNDKGQLMQDDHTKPKYEFIAA